MDRNEVAARREKIGKYLQNHANSWVTRSEIGKLFDISVATVTVDANHIVKTSIGGSIESSRNHGIMWIPDPVVIDVNEKMKEDARKAAAAFSKTEIMFAKGKNSEGYPDPTANMAIRNTEPQARPIFSGDVWLASRSDGRTDTCLILRNLGERSICVVIDKTASLDDGYVSYGRQKIDCTRIQSKPNKYFIDHVEIVTPTVMSKVREKLADILGIETSIIVGEPAVNEVAIREEIAAEYEKKLIDQKIDIYERILFRK